MIEFKEINNKRIKIYLKCFSVFQRFSSTIFAVDQYFKTQG